MGTNAICLLFSVSRVFRLLPQPRYKDPKRGDVNFQVMMEEKADAEARDANPKAGSEKGCAGCKN